MFLIGGRFGVGLLVGLLVVGLLGCEQKPAAESTAERGAAAAPATQPTEQDLAAVRSLLGESGASPSSTMPPGHPPTGAAPTPPASDAAASLPPGHPPTGAPAALKWDVPAAWEAVPLSAGSMRRAQYALPKADEDPSGGEVAVFHFPGSGGGVEANIQRWVGQFSDSDGGPVDPKTVQRETFDVGECTVHFVDLTGYMTIGQMMGGTGQRSANEYRLLGAIVEAPAGRWFFKGTGPAATMAAAREDFVELLKSVR